MAGPHGRDRAHRVARAGRFDAVQSVDGDHRIERLVRRRSLSDRPATRQLALGRGERLPVRLVQLHLPLLGRRVLRAGVRPSRIWNRRRLARAVRPVRGDLLSELRRRRRPQSRTFS